LKPWHTFLNSTTKDDKVEVLATSLGTFILGGSFAKEFFTNGHFELRIFLFGLSSFALLLAISLIAEIKMSLYKTDKKLLSLSWIFFFLLGTFASIDLFWDQFIIKGSGLDIRAETLVFLSSYTISTNLLYLLNREVLQEALRRKTIYKYLLAPLNGLSLGIVSMGAIVWLVG
jgi:hypothetical protein